MRVISLCERADEVPVRIGGKGKEEGKMGIGTLIKKVHMNCPLCDKMHEVEERVRMATCTIKGKKVTYEERFYLCAYADEDENEFETAAMANENMLKARNAYREQQGLLTSDEIVVIRENYGLSQVDLARLLGWGEATISRYESKAIQDEAYDTMLRLLKENPLQALEFLKKNSDKFSKYKHSEIKERITEKLDDYGKEFLKRRSFEGEYAEFGEASESNGFATLNIDKIEAAISYIAERVSNLYKVKLMKLLWYADALSFACRGRAMTGLVYRHGVMGALPIGHYSLMSLENVNVKEEIGADYNSIFRIRPCERADYSVLGADEKDILNQVTAKFREFNTSEIVEYMHKERAYLETRSGEIIPFREEYSVCLKGD